MARILADIPDEDVKWLDRIAAEQGKSRAAVLREAVSNYKAQPSADGSKDWLDQAFGLWARNGVAVDPHAYERERRAEWTRTWDDDYEEVRAQSPEYFTQEDDRARAHYLALIKKADEETDKTGQAGKSDKDAT